MLTLAPLSPTSVTVYASSATAAEAVPYSEPLEWDITSGEEELESLDIPTIQLSDFVSVHFAEAVSAMSQRQVFSLTVAENIDTSTHDVDVFGKAERA
jgi:hypothetical protein